MISINLDKRSNLYWRKIKVASRFPVKTSKIHSEKTKIKIFILLKLGDIFKVKTNESFISNKKMSISKEKRINYGLKGKLRRNQKSEKTNPKLIDIKKLESIFKKTS